MVETVGAPVSDLEVKPLQRDNYMDVHTCCRELSELIPNLEDDIINGRVKGYLAYIAGATCVGSILWRLDVSENLKNSPLPMPRARILFIEVSKAFRGRGIASELMDTFLEAQKPADIASVSIKLYKNYQEAIHFFEKFGFEMIKTERNWMILKKSLWSDFGVMDLSEDEII
jgi:ribosomal protein S18 acetylase RimI-like enzyme